VMLAARRGSAAEGMRLSASSNGDRRGTHES
jgi:hypothetical protein